jgi:hypothetical protein
MLETVDSVPHMDDEGLRCFQDTLKASQCYLEYGSGGSTVYAANVAQVRYIISVESDRLWADRVKAAINAPNCNLHLQHCDIGEVGNWGTPRTREKIDEFWRYSATPWQIAKQNHLVPDTVLIDGRFRVASFLFSLVTARIGTTILFDDYFDRPEYFVVEEYCQVEQRRGAMALFISSRKFSISDICATIARYSIVWG